MRIPARLQKSQLSEYFFQSIAERIASDIWGKNICIILQAKNGKHYYVSYKFKDYDNQWIQLKVAKPVKDKPGYFHL
jgi:hypothetical protein